MRVSFVIPSYNQAAWLPHAVKSCQDQTQKDIEVIIIDDCSTDTTGEYIKWLLAQNDKRIVYHRNETNKGRSFSRNLGNQMATGEAICVLDADDLAINERAEWTAKKLKKCQVCYGSTILITALGETNKTLHAAPLDKEKILKPIDFVEWKKESEKGKDIDLIENHIVHSSMGYLKSIALKYPYADGRISDMGIDDWEQQIRMIRDGVIFDYIPDVICAYRVHSAGVSKTRNAEEVIKLKSELLSGVTV